MFIQLLLLGLVLHLFRKNWKQLVLGAQMIFLASLGFAIGQMDTIYHKMKFGSNSLVLTRDLTSVELYGMKISDLLLPYTHLWSAVQKWTHSVYFDLPFLIHTEAGPSYLGILGSIAFLFAMTIPFLNHLKNKQTKEVAWLVFLYWILFYSLSGGLNFVISATSGLYLFRCTNRYSIIVMMIAILLGLKAINLHFGRKFAFLLIAIVLMDLPGRQRYETYADIKLRVDADRDFASRVEKVLAPHSKIFQMPIVDFPEYPQVHLMSDYEHFRPTLYTNLYQWSYGAMKGRPDNNWQKNLETKPLPEQIEILKAKGFSALYLNKRGFADGGASITSQMNTRLPAIDIIDSLDLVLFRIQ